MQLQSQPSSAASHIAGQRHGQTPPRLLVLVCGNESSDQTRDVGLFRQWLLQRKQHRRFLLLLFSFPYQLWRSLCGRWLILTSSDQSTQSAAILSTTAAISSEAKTLYIAKKPSVTVVGTLPVTSAASRYLRRSNQKDLSRVLGWVWGQGGLSRAAKGARLSRGRAQSFFRVHISHLDVVLYQGKGSCRSRQELPHGHRHQPHMHPPSPGAKGVNTQHERGVPPRAAEPTEHCPPTSTPPTEDQVWSRLTALRCSVSQLGLRLLCSPSDLLQSLFLLFLAPFCSLVPPFAG